MNILAIMLGNWWINNEFDNTEFVNEYIHVII